MRKPQLDAYQLGWDDYCQGKPLGIPQDIYRYPIRKTAGDSPLRCYRRGWRDAQQMKRLKVEGFQPVGINPNGLPSPVASVLGAMLLEDEETWNRENARWLEENPKGREE